MAFEMNSSLQKAWQALEEAERQLLLCSGWRHVPPNGWFHRQWSAGAVPQAEAVKVTRRRILRAALLRGG